MALPVHLVGSINLADTESVLQNVARAIGGLAERLPDGETGERLTWTAWLIPTLRENRSLEERPPVTIAGLEFPQFALRPGISPQELSIPLPYVDIARESYAVFQRLKQQGAIPAGTRFQVSLPTPAAILLSFIDAEHRLLLESPLERAMVDVVTRIAALAPAGELAIQWDAPAEIGVLENVFPTYYSGEPPAPGAARRLARLGDIVPAGTQLGYHLCYGDTGDVDNPDGSHWKNPDDLTVLVALMNDIAGRVGRGIDYFHVPVPIDRSDNEYFAPLDTLHIPDECALFLGLLHREDGLDGARARAASAEKYRKKFGIATECGMGRERRESITALLEPR